MRGEKAKEGNMKREKGRKRESDRPSVISYI